jgi:hypothetical protein
MIDARFDAGEHGSVVGHFLVDSITSASASSGATSGAFNENRVEAGGGYTHELPGRLKLGADLRYSAESDYFSTWLDVHAELELLDQTTRLGVLLGHSFDTITNGVAVAQGGLGTPSFERSLGVSLASLSATQILTPVLVGFVGFDLGYLNGYQANLYRQVPGGAEPVAERVPDVRWRTALYGELRGHLGATSTTGVLGYRLYIDDWGIVAHTPEVRVIQEIVPGLDVRLRYRFYTQSAASFYRAQYTQAELDDMAMSVTQDEKLSSFRTHTLGGQLSVALSILGFREAFARMRIDAVVERVWQTTSFGDAWVGQLGLSVPFSY